MNHNRRVVFIQPTSPPTPTSPSIPSPLIFADVQAVLSHLYKEGKLEINTDCIEKAVVLCEENFVDFELEFSEFGQTKNQTKIFYIKIASHEPNHKQIK